MLQVVTGMYFRPGAAPRRTRHRATLYTNCVFLPAEPIQLEVGRLLPASGFDAITTLTVEVDEWLEVDQRDGETFGLVSTGGQDLIDDLGHVLSFALDATLSTDRDLVESLVEDAAAPRRRYGTPSGFLTRTFDPGVVIRHDDIEGTDAFVRTLIDLPRSDFERALRAIKRMVLAIRRAATDPTAAYADVVAALESLADERFTTPITWSRYDGAKAKLIDQALVGIDPTAADRIRHAIIEADKLGARRRFIDSTAARLTESFFRAEAAGLSTPLRSSDVSRVLSTAYAIRSGNSHVLESLPPETWVFSGAETAELVDVAHRGRSGLVLTLQGLWRMARHVVRTYVEEASGGEFEPFDYAPHLPGSMTLRWSEEYWVGEPSTLTKETALERFSSVLTLAANVVAGHLDGPPDLRPLVEKAMTIVPGLHPREERTCLIAIVAIWDRMMPADLQPAGAAEFLARYRGELDAPGLTGFATAIIATDAAPPWSAAELLRLSDARDHQRRRGKGGQPLPPRFDAALHAAAAVALAKQGDAKSAVKCAARAVGEVPGDPTLIDWEDQIRRGADPTIDIAAVTVGPVADDGTSDEAPA